MNPPYGPALPVWMAKAYASSLEGATVVCLAPARTDTRWWHDFAMRGEIRLIQGRLRFGHAPSVAPFPSAIIVFRPKRYLSFAVNGSRVAHAVGKRAESTAPILPTFLRAAGEKP
jgi:hypothetical protein